MPHHWPLLINPTSPKLAETQSRDLQTAARSYELQLHVLHASTDRDFETAFESVARLRAGGLVISSDHSYSAAAIISPRWLLAMLCPRSLDFVSSSRLGAWPHPATRKHASPRQ